MGDGSLSQDEIDALLSPGGDEDSGGMDLGGDGGGELDLDSLLDGGDGGGGDAPTTPGLDSDALSSLMDAVGPAIGGTPTPAGGGAPRPAAPQKSGGDNNVDLLMDVTLRFTVELGRTHMYIKDVLNLSEGSVVELDKNVGDEVDILVNDRLFGRGKLIVMDEYFGVQITHILDPMSRFSVL